MKDFYITTAIDYANGKPHLGHAYEKILTDTIARSRRLRGERVYFLTGMDEHGQKVQQSAEREGVAPIDYCDRIAGHFQDLCEHLSISNDDFIRTTEERHKRVVRQLLQNLYDSDQIYLADYTGFYSTRAEQFLQERDKVNGQWPEEYGEVKEITEHNYFFRLSNYQDWLIDYLKKHDDFVFPRFRLKQVLEFLKEPLNDLCISRPVERLSWGIPLPFDEKYVTYVWFDALTNYISAVGYGGPDFDRRWPVDYHVIGKDILVPPHAVYWPIMLQACGIPLPKHLLVHGWWMMTGGGKMSKSTGLSVDPLALADRFGADAFRYFVTREMSVGQDSEFTEELFLARYNNDLGNDLGNLVSRLLNMAGRYSGGVVPEAGPAGEPEQAVHQLWSETGAAVLEKYDGFLFHSGLDSTFTFIRQLNRYAETRAPWKLAKSTEESDQLLLRTSLATLAEGLRLAALLLMPIMPSIAPRILELLGADAVEKWTEENLAWGNSLAGRQMADKAILFPRV